MANLVSSPCATSILCGCLAFAFPAVPHFNNRHLRVTCSPSRASTATCTAPSTNPCVTRVLLLYVPVLLGWVAGWGLAKVSTWVVSHFSNTHNANLSLNAPKLLRGSPHPHEDAVLTALPVPAWQIRG
jgi:hypothetical protein